MPPAARVTDMHVCPMVTGLVPHVGGPILPPGAPTVLIDFFPAATVTNMLTCVGPPDVIAMGSAGVFINFLPAARLGDQTAHGGVVVMGSPTCIIGEVGPPNPGTAGASGIFAGLTAALGLDKALATIYGITANKLDSLVKTSLEFAGRHLAGRQSVEKFLGGSQPSGVQQYFDGKVIGAGCAPSDPSTARTAKGMRPTKCADPSKTIPKVYFANGILTDLYGQGSTMCSTMQHIADQTCAEVVGIYGATKGPLSDVNQALQQIKGGPDSAQVTTLTQLMTQSLDSDHPQSVNLVAHSRGGLAMQQAIGNTKLALGADMPPAQVDKALSNLNVAVYGTGENGWPVGPEYTKLNNSGDPIPSVIKGAQDAFPKKTFSDSDKTPTVIINQPKLNPADAHSVDGIYVDQMGKAEGARDCDCS